MNENVDYCMAPDPTPFWKRHINRLFGPYHPPTPDLPEWATDGVSVDTRVNFSFVDRIRILFSGKVFVRSWTACENPPGRAESTSSAIVQSPFEP
jgi:transposase InsO family protein